MNKQITSDIADAIRRTHESYGVAELDFSDYEEDFSDTVTDISEYVSDSDEDMYDSDEPTSYIVTIDSNGMRFIQEVPDVGFTVPGVDNLTVWGRAYDE